MKDRIDRAVATLRGYCAKVTDCCRCRYAQGENNGDCPFQGELPPCDLDMDDRRKEKQDEKS